MGLDELEELAVRSVRSFRLSTTRRNHMASLRAIFAWLADVHIAGELWIDGSFMTRKIDPSDIDMILRLRSDEFESRSKRDALNNIVSDDIYNRMKCDIYLLLEHPESDTSSFVKSQKQRRFVIRTFGHQVKNRQPKGIAVVNLAHGAPSLWNS